MLKQLSPDSVNGYMTASGAGGKGQSSRDFLENRTQEWAESSNGFKPLALAFN